MAKASNHIDLSKGIGVIHCRTVKYRTPFRVFYPSKTTTTKSDVKWFLESFTHFVEGYFHVVLPRLRSSNVLHYICFWIIKIISLIFYFTDHSIPNCKLHADPMSNESYPLIIYSHGLTGTSEEHSLMFAHWAQRGYVVAAIHHCDGSSHRANTGDGIDILYHHPPNIKNYDENFRPNQILRRENEIYDLSQYILNDDSFPSIIRNIINDKCIMIAGFSYGAATASLSVVKHPNYYKACILLDGWFHIEVGKGFDFPKEVHEHGLNIPALFIGSEQFANRLALSNATVRLYDNNTRKDVSQYHVIKDSRHQNFTGKYHSL
jgi:hypothetical protein